MTNSSTKRTFSARIRQTLLKARWPNSPWNSVYNRHAFCRQECKQGPYRRALAVGSRQPVPSTWYTRLLHSAMHKRLLIMQRPIYDSWIQFQFRMKWINFAFDVRRATDKVLYLQNRHILPPPLSPAPLPTTTTTKAMHESNEGFLQLFSCVHAVCAAAIEWWKLYLSSTVFWATLWMSQGCELRCRWRRKKWQL